jgi:hypothetical protein
MNRPLAVVIFTVPNGFAHIFTSRKSVVNHDGSHRFKHKKEYQQKICCGWIWREEVYRNKKGQN